MYVESDGIYNLEYPYTVYGAMGLSNLEEPESIDVNQINCVDRHLVVTMVPVN